MDLKKMFVLLALSFLTMSTVFAQDPGDMITGIWLNDENSAKIEIIKDGSSYSGKTIWLAQQRDKNGNPLVDSKNPDSEKRNLPVLGLTILSGLEYFDGKWTGSIYVPKYGQSADCTVKLKSTEIMKIIISKGLFSRTKTWTRLK